MKYDEGTRLMVLAPVVRGKKGFHKDVLDDLFSQGWQRARVNGDVVDLRDVLSKGTENPLDLHRHKKHSIDAVVDRVVVKPDARQRLVESIEASLRLADGAVIVSTQRSPERERRARFGRVAVVRGVCPSRTLGAH